MRKEKRALMGFERNLYDPYILVDTTRRGKRFASFDKTEAEKYANKIGRKIEWIPKSEILNTQRKIYGD